MLRALRRAGPLQSACITPVRVHARCLATSERANPPWAMDKLVAFAKQRGFVFPSSEVYGAVGAGYDYGPLGVQLKKNIQDRWWRDFVTRRSDCVGLDSAIILNRRVWAASGHVEQFVDPLTECRSCRKRVRADKLVLSEGAARLAALDKKKDASPTPDAAAAEALAGRRQLFARCADAASVAAMSLSDMGAAIHDLGCRCPGCGAAGEAGLATPKMFNLLFQTHVGATVPAPAGASGATPQSAAAPAAEASTPTAAAAAVETAAVTGAGAASDAGSKQPKGGKKGSKGSAAASGASSAAAAASASSSAAALESADGVAYLRPETAQGVYVNFSNVANASRLRLPFGIGQTGKSFRNEVAVGNFIFRTREFEQMELQYFCAPTESMQHYTAWVSFCEDWLLRLGIRRGSVQRKEYERKELAHYALATTDLMFRFPFGWEELWGIANRGDFDLRCHAAASGAPLQYTDPDTKASFYPHAVEPAVGLNRLVLAFMCDGLEDEPLPDGTSRTLFRIHEDLAPVSAAVLPVVKNREPIMAMAHNVAAQLRGHSDGIIDFDATQSIGKRYRRQDEVGTPLCITIDGASVEDGTVTVRDRDSMKQIRMHVKELVELAERRKLKPSALAEHFAAAPQATAGSGGSGSMGDAGAGSVA